MGKSNPEVSIPGAPAAPAASAPPNASPEEAAAAAAGGQGVGFTGNAEGAAGPDPRDAEIANLRAQLAAAQAIADPSKMLVVEADGPNTRRYKAESKHLHLTADQLHQMVMSGEVKLTEHHVLCKDGWYVNPQAQRQANG